MPSCRCCYMNEQRPVRIGFAGLGWPGEQHAKAALTLPAASLEAACDLNAERLEKFAGEYGPRKRYARYEEMLADAEVDAVVISLPNFLHYSATLSALQAGKHVLCEKPPTLNVAEIEHIREEVRARGLTYFFGRQSRFSSAMLAARRVVATGGLGEVYFVRAERVRSRGIPAWGGGWFLEKARSGGGAMIDIGVHALDAAWYLLGCPRPLSVSAQVSSPFRHLVPPEIAYDVEDTGFAFIRFEGGAVLHLEVAWAANVTDAAPVSSWAGHETENTTLYGNRATLRLDPAALFTMRGSERVETALEVEAEADPFANQLTDFLGAVRRGTEPTNNVGQAVMLMKMLAGIYESSSTKKEMQLGG